MVSRKVGSMASMSGADDMVYMEYRSAKPQHPLFKLRRQHWKLLDSNYYILSYISTLLYSFLKSLSAIYVASFNIQTDIHLPSSHNSITDLLMSRTMWSTPQFSCSWINRARKVLANHGTATTSHGDPHTISSLWNCGIVNRLVASPDCRWSLAETKTQKIKECKNAIKSSPNY